MHSLLAKLQYKNQEEIHVLGAPPEFAETLKELRKTARVVTDPTSEGPVDFALIFVRSRAEAQAAAGPVLARVTPTAPVWFAYPKKSSTRYVANITRDDGWQSLSKLGYRQVSLVSINDDWSVLRFRRSEDIKSNP
jgi:hypothetical protein